MSYDAGNAILGGCYAVREFTGATLGRGFDTAVSWVTGVNAHTAEIACNRPEYIGEIYAGTAKGIADAATGNGDWAANCCQNYEEAAIDSLDQIDNMKNKAAELLTQNLGIDIAQGHVKDFINVLSLKNSDGTFNITGVLVWILLIAIVLLIIFVIVRLLAGKAKPSTDTSVPDAQTDAPATNDTNDSNDLSNDFQTIGFGGDD